MIEGERRACIAIAAAAIVCARALAASPPQDESAREGWQSVPEIFEAMGVREGATVADVGAGGGFLTIRLARVVGSTGRVKAVDVSATEVDRLRARLDRDGIANVDVVKGDPDDPHLPPASLDAV